MFLVGDSTPCVNLDASFCECGSNVVLGGERVASGDGDCCAGGVEALGEDGGFGFQVEAHSDSMALESLVSCELFCYACEHRHVQPGPFDFQPA